MLRLTLRSASDGRYLARIIERNGVAFVLDYGDPKVIAGASKRVLAGGFSVEREGQLLTAGPGDPRILQLLAELYALEGVLAFLEEPDWKGRGWSLEDALPLEPVATVSAGQETATWEDLRPVTLEDSLLERVRTIDDDVDTAILPDPRDALETLDDVEDTEILNRRDLGLPDGLEPMPVAPFDLAELGPEDEETELAPLPVGHKVKAEDLTAEFSESMVAAIEGLPLPRPKGPKR